MSVERDELPRRFLSQDYGRVVGVVSLVCPSRAAAEDAVQEALVKAWARRDSPANFTAWITVLALNLAKSAGRRSLAEQRSYARLPDRADGPQSLEDAAGQRRDLAVALRALSRRQREVVVLHYWLDLSVQQIAELLAVGPGSVKKQLFRARAALAAVLADADQLVGER